MSPVHDRFRSAIDWPTFLARQDPRWRSIPPDYFAAPFVGNGLVGTIIFRDDQDPRALRFEIGRTDVYDHRIGGSAIHDQVRLPIGQLLLLPVGDLLACDLRIDLWNAEIIGHLTTTVGRMDLRCLAPSGSEVLLIELTTSAGEAEARFQFRPQRGDSPRWLVDPFRDWHYRYHRNPEPRTHRQGDLETTVQALNAGGDYATSWTEERQGAGHRRILLATAFRWGAGLTPWEGSAADAEATVQGARADVAGLVARHRDWWHAYYPASLVSVPDARLEGFYWLQVYKLASATRGDTPVVDLLGPWFKTTVWAAYWQNLNTQLPYDLPRLINHPEICEGPARLIERRQDQLIANVPPAWRHDSAALGNPTGHDSLDAPAPGPEHLGPGQSYHLIGLPWLLQQFYLLVRSTGDDARLRTSVFPLLKRSTNTFFHCLRREEDGRLHLARSFSDEYGDAEDANQNLALLRWSLETLLAIDDRLGLGDADRPRWESVLRDLTPPPVDPAHGLMVGRGVGFDRAHRHYSHLFAIFPLHLLTPERCPDQADLIRRSIARFTELQGDEALFKFVGAASLQAVLGEGDAALGHLRRALAIHPRRLPDPQAIPVSSLGENTLYGETSVCPFNPTFESPIALARALVDLLFQTWGGIIRIFPALPTDWADAVFQDLRAEGAFLVSAVRRGGHTRLVRIVSLQGEPCRVRLGTGEVPNAVHGATAHQNAAGLWTLVLPAGGEALMTFHATTAEDLTLSPLAGGASPWGLP